MVFNKACIEYATPEFGYLQYLHIVGDGRAYAVYAGILQGASLQAASPDVVQWAPALPKTRSGKIMRRILRKIAADESGQLGDVSTLADPSVVDSLVRDFREIPK